MEYSRNYWDVFISHASEDKEEIARPLAEALSRAGLRVWFDEFTLKVGQSISESINYGLANSVYGIVILSEHYLSKDWTKRELAGLFAKEQNEKIILPIWHKITLERVKSYSPIMADRLALNSSVGIPKITHSLMEVIAPNSHPAKSLPSGPKVFISYAWEPSEKKPLGLWHGLSGRLRLFETPNERYQFEGDYDWNTFEWAGHLVGNYSNGILDFYWWWDKSPARGSGYFTIDPMNHTLIGGWSDTNTRVGLVDENTELLLKKFQEWVFDKVEIFFEGADLWKE